MVICAPMSSKYCVNSNSRGKNGSNIKDEHKPKYLGFEWKSLKYKDSNKYSNAGVHVSSSPSKSKDGAAGYDNTILLEDLLSSPKLGAEISYLNVLKFI